MTTTMWGAQPGAPTTLRWTRAAFALAEEAGAFDDLRVELLDGVIIDMGRMNMPHAQGLRRVRDALLPAEARGYELHQQVRLSLWAMLPTDSDDPQPDALLIDRDGSVALVVEVADSSLTIDLERKPRVYALADVPAYWVLDLNGRRLYAHAGPLERGTYQVVTTLEADAMITGPGGVGTVAVADLLGPGDA